MNSSTNEELTEVIPEKPKQVRIAIVLLYAYLALIAIGYVVSFYQNSRTLDFSLELSRIVCWAIIIPIYLFLVYQVSKRKSRARIFLLIWFFYDNCMSIYLIYSFPPRNILYYGLLVSLVGLVATILLFISPSKAWFEYHKQDKRENVVTENDGVTEKEAER